MSYQSTILEDSPVGFWPLTETSGTTATDLGSGGNNGTYNGTPTLGKTGLVFEAGGVCPDFDGTDGRVSLPSGFGTLMHGVSKFNFECWFNTSYSGGTQYLFMGDVPDGNGGILVYINTDGSISLDGRSANGGAYQSEDTTETGFNDGETHYIVVEYNYGDSTWHVYIDEAKLTMTGQPTWTSSTYNANSNGFEIGRNNAGLNYFNGKIAYPTVYTDVTLTPLQIRKHYQAGLATGLHKEILDLGPDFYAPLNEATGDALDWSGNDNNGTPAGDITQAATGLLAYDTSTGYQFDGVNGEIPISHPASTTTYSLFAALSINSATGEYKILEDGGVGHWSIKNGKQNLNYSASDHLGTATLGTATLVTVGITVNAGAVTFYTDGASDGSASSAIALDFETLSDAAASFDGTLQAVVRYPTALTAANHRTLSMAARTLIEDRGYPKVIANLTPSFYARLGEASGTTAFDESGNDNDGTINGSPVLATAGGPLHQSRLTAMTFDGVDDYVDTGETIPQTGAVLMWFKNDGYISNSFSGVDFPSLNISASGVGFDYFPNNSLTGRVTHAITATGGGAWDCAVAVFDGSNFISYFNGAVLQTTAGGTLWANTRSTLIGREPNSANYHQSDGTAEIVILSTAPSDQQIKQIYEAGRSRYAAEVISYEPFSYKRMNDASGAVVDYGSNGSDGTAIGSPTYSVADTPITNEPSHTTMSFNGSSQYINDDGSTFEDLNLTFIAWAKGGTTGLNEILSLRDGSGGLSGLRDQADRTSFFLLSDGTNSDHVTSLSTLSNSQWTMLTGVGDTDNDNGKIYFDGVLEGQTSGTLGATFGGLTKATIGASFYSGSYQGFYNGSLCEIAAWDGVKLTPAQILDIYEMASYSLAPATYKVIGTITESLDPTQWLVRAYNFDTGEHLADDIATGSYSIETDPYSGPVGIIAHPDMGSMWTASTAVVVGDRVYPTNPTANNRYFECTTAGTTDASEPTWPSSGTVNDNGVVWTFVSDFVRPRAHGPVKPTLSS